MEDLTLYNVEELISDPAFEYIEELKKTENLRT